MLASSMTLLRMLRKLLRSWANGVTNTSLLRPLKRNDNERDLFMH